MDTSVVPPKTATKRLVFLDVLRGLMLVGIALGHFGNTFVWLAWQPLGYFSNAEGFILLSGTVFGLVYTRLYIRNPTQLAGKATRRAGLIYLNHLGLLVFVAAFTLLTQGMSEHWHSHAVFLDHEPLKGMILGALMLYQPPLLDILPMYALFVLLGPLIVRLLVLNRWQWVLGISVLTWLFFSQVLYHGLWRESLALAVGLKFPYQTGSFDPMVWQLLFFLGLMLGYRMITSTVPQKPKGYLIVLCAGIALYLFSLRHGYLPFPPYWSSLWVERKDLGVIRLLDIGALTYLLWSIVHYTRHVEWSSGMCRVRDFFARMGRHSLPVFTAHVVLIYLTIPIQHTGGLWARYGTGIGLIIILYALAWLLDARADQQKRMKQASPA